MRRLVITGALSMGLGLAVLSQANSVLASHLDIFHAVAGRYVALRHACVPDDGQQMVYRRIAGWPSAFPSMGTSIGGLIIPMVVSIELHRSHEWQGALISQFGSSTVILIPLNLIVLRFEPPLANQESNTPGKPVF